MIEPIYHSGELAIQGKAGVSEQARNASLLIHEQIPKIAREFLSRQRMAILSTRDAGGSVWASALTGKPGFMQAVDSKTVEIDARPTAGDPLAANLHTGEMVGVFVIEFSTRMRMKVKGRAELPGEGRLLVHAARVYSQCRKYIQSRVLLEDSLQLATEKEVVRGESLTSSQQEWIAKADTFFVASFHHETGADAAHRGGNPGFVEVLDQATLAFPNYWGNTMFNTLGNIAVDPHAGLLFLNFATGSTLQLTGTARVIWDQERISKFPGANQVVEYQVNQTVETPHAMPLRWRFLAYSGSNPTALSSAVPAPTVSIETH